MTDISYGYIWMQLDFYCLAKFVSVFWLAGADKNMAQKLVGL